MKKPSGWSIVTGVIVAVQGVLTVAAYKMGR